ncbi:amidohydrolase family protein [Lactiplantibacillus plantarum]|uniref:amidohydrolase family protein n=1 Tax=Lactiplantibacillus plantarum TaxID=1590 RepID=UPI001C58DFED|nr:amidohydrolase family protein [Lactiplantibacillus plantarum]MBW1621899.1 amidohydrolase [Lactiplantibacillus plantarum]
MSKIDFHTHYLPTSYVEALKRHVPGDPDGWPTPEWTPQLTLNFMRDNDISYSILSLSSPHVNFGDKAETIRLVEAANDDGKSLAQQYPDQLGYLASLPIPYELDAVKTVQQALDQDGALGVTVPTNSRGLYFGSPVLERVYQELDARQAIVALHPNEPAILPKNVDIDLPVPLLGFFMDTTMTFINMLKYHFFEKYPNIKVIIPHAGAFLGIVDDRIAQYAQKVYQVDVYDVMHHVYFDVAGAVLPRQLPTLMSLAQPEHLLYGSDIPYTPLDGSRQLGHALATADLLTNEQKQAIFYDNAHRLLTE